MDADFAVLRENETGARRSASAGILRRLPVGAEPHAGGRRAFPRLGAALSRDRGRDRRRCRRSRSTPRRTAISPAWRADARPGMRYGFRTDTRDQAAARPGLALSAGRAARAVGNRRSRRVPLDRPGLARPPARGAGHLRDACRHLHPGGHLGGGCARTARAGRARHHLHRADAGRRFPRPLRLGL